MAKVSAVKAVAPVEVGNLQDKFLKAMEIMRGSMIERDVEIEILFTALLIREHVLLVGPPGCGKSHMLNAMMNLLQGKLFAYLMGKYTTPEELFGTLDMRALKEGRLVRVTKGKLPEADAGYLDEIYKAGPAILNTLLTIMNEGTYDDGNGSKKVPLRFLLASSNEFPNAEDGLNAMHDRFLFRKVVRYVSSMSGRNKLLWGGDHVPHFGSLEISMDEVDQAHDEVKQVPFSSEAKQVMSNIIDKLRSDGIHPSDRRMIKALQVCQATAWLMYPSRLDNDSKAKLEVTTEDFDLLAHCLWVEDTQAQKAASIVASVSNPVIFEVNTLLQQAEEIIQAIDTKDLAKLAKQSTELKKLSDILDRLKAMKKHPRVEGAINHVAEQLKQIKIALTSV